MASLSIRRAMLKDIPLIRELSQKIWPETYGSIISSEQLEYMLELMYSEVALKKQMDEQHEFIIVSDGAEPIGFASFSMVEPAKYKLHKIYILPGSQGKGAGRFVIEQVIKAIIRKGGTALKLNVNRNNKARGFYERLGFTMIGEEDIDIGNGYFMNDYIMEWTVNR